MNWKEALKLYIRAVYDSDHVVAGNAADELAEPYRTMLLRMWNELEAETRRKWDEHEARLSESK